MHSLPLPPSLSHTHTHAQTQIHTHTVASSRARANTHTHTHTHTHTRTHTHTHTHTHTSSFCPTSWDVGSRHNLFGNHSAINNFEQTQNTSQFLKAKDVNNRLFTQPCHPFYDPSLRGTQVWMRTDQQIDKHHDQSVQARTFFSHTESLHSCLCHSCPKPSPPHTPPPNPDGAVRPRRADECQWVAWRDHLGGRNDRLLIKAYRISSFGSSVNEDFLCVFCQ